MRNTSNRFRTGRSSRTRSLCRRCVRYTTRMLGGARRPPPPNYLAQLCRITSQYIRLRERMARREPHLFDYAAIDRRLAWEAEVQRALERIYGTAPAPSPSPSPVGTSSTSSPTSSSLAPSDGERAGVRGIPLPAQIVN